jgi:hypothetical protein
MCASATRKQGTRTPYPSVSIHARDTNCLHLTSHRLNQRREEKSQNPETKLPGRGVHIPQLLRHSSVYFRSVWPPSCKSPLPLIGCSAAAKRPPHFCRTTQHPAPSQVPFPIPFPHLPAVTVTTTSSLEVVSQPASGQCRQSVPTLLGAVWLCSQRRQVSTPSPLQYPSPPSSPSPPPTLPPPSLLHPSRP